MIGWKRERMTLTHVLAAVPRESASQYYRHLSEYRDFKLSLVSDIGDALDALNNRDEQTDVFVLDNRMPNAAHLIGDLRDDFPRLLIVLVDEDADFATPGAADEISTDPFNADDLARRITRLMSDRRLDTLRADAMPPVREFAKRLRSATGEGGKAQATVSACRDLGYDYIAFYRLESTEPLRVTLRAQDGAAAVQAVAPKQAAGDDLIGTVAQSGQSRIAGPGDDVTHPLVKRGRLGVVACVPVGVATRYGVLVACRDKPDSITPDNLITLELVSAQLAAVIAREASG